jgi:hypothetical protein
MDINNLLKEKDKFPKLFALALARNYVNSEAFTSGSYLHPNITVSVCHHSFAVHSIIQWFS